MGKLMHVLQELSSKFQVKISRQFDEAEFLHKLFSYSIYHTLRFKRKRQYFQLLFVCEHAIGPLVPPTEIGQIEKQAIK